MKLALFVKGAAKRKLNVKTPSEDQRRTILL